MRLLIIVLVLLTVLAPLAQGQATREAALDAIGEAEICIARMKEFSLTTLQVEDKLLLAHSVLERADLAVSLEQGLTGPAAELATKSLQGLPSQEKTYDGVLLIADDICLLEREALDTLDALTVFDTTIEEYELPPQQEEGLGNLITPAFILPDKKTLVDTSEAEALLAQAQQAFDEERYEEAQSLLLEAQANLDEKEAEITTLNVIASASTNFFEKYWLELVLVVVLIGAAGSVGWRHHQAVLLRRKVKGMRTEKRSLIELMKKAQENRFKKQTIPDSLYKVKMNTYTKRLEEVKEQLPALEARLSGKEVKTKKAKNKYGRKKH